MIAFEPGPAYTLAFLVRTAHGPVAGVRLPGDAGPVPVEVLDRLHPLEAQVASALHGFRQVQFAGGRLAAGELLRSEGQPGAVLPDRWGAPVGPPGVLVSISHKRDLAVAIVRRGAGGVGIDCEEVSRVRPGVEERILCADELAAVHGLPEGERWAAVVARFAAKEAVYKAIHPRLRRYVGFQEVAVWPHGEQAAVELRLRAGERLHCEVRLDSLPGRVLAFAHAGWAG